MSCARAVTRLWKPAIVLWGLVGLATVILIARLGSVAVAVGVALLCAALTGPVTRRVINFHSLPRRFRPRFS